MRNNEIDMLCHLAAAEQALKMAEATPDRQHLLAAAKRQVELADECLETLKRERLWVAAVELGKIEAAHKQSLELFETKVDLIDFLRRQKLFSERTFGPSSDTTGIMRHIALELDEVRADPGDLEEWIDIVILAFDGARRAGFSPEQIAFGLLAKQTKNESRSWPDWRTVEKGRPILHVKEGEET